MAKLDFKSLFQPEIIICINLILAIPLFFSSSWIKAGGRASLISLLLFSIMLFYFTLCMKEVLLTYKRGIYSFLKHIYGDFVSFLAMWLLWIAGNLAFMVVFAGAINYLIPSDKYLFLKIILSLMWIAVFSFILIRNKEGARKILLGFSALTIMLLFAVIVVSALNINASSPFFTANGIIGNISPVLLSIFFMSIGFLGMLLFYLFSGDKLPETSISGAVIAGVFGILVSAFALSAYNYSMFGDVFAFSIIGGKYEWLAILLMYIALLGVTSIWLYTAPNILIALSQDNLLPRRILRLSRYKTAVNAILFQGVAFSIFAFFGFYISFYTAILNMTIPLVLFVVYLILLGALLSKKRDFDLERQYKTNKYIIFALIIALLFAFFAWTRSGIYVKPLLKLEIVLLLFSAPLYLLLSMFFDYNAVNKINDLFSYLSLLTERIVLTKLVKKKIFSYFDDIEGKKVLDYNCNIGTLTIEAAKLVGTKGAVYGVEMSNAGVNICSRRLKKAGIGNTNLLKDSYLVRRVHPSIPKVNFVVSFGMLGYAMDIRKILHGFHKILPDKGRICFADCTELLKIFPNPQWLNEEAIKEIFRDEGFSAFVIHEKGILWNYMYIYGIKSKKDVPFVE